MGLFSWLGSLLDQLVAWLGSVFAAFFEALMWALEKVWETVVAAALIAAFGVVGILYVIFYAGAMLGETIMEVWDPNYVNSKPSKVFNLRQAPQDSPLPRTRDKAQILYLENCLN